jgi:hypothetical protein
MKCKIFDVELGKGEMLMVEPLGDMHYGNPAFVYEKFKERVEAIRKDGNRYWIGMGDYIDNIRPYRGGMVDKRWTTEVLKGIGDWDEQLSGLLDFFEPIKDKCIGLLWGNHEWATITAKEFTDRVCWPLGVDFLGGRCFVLLRVKSKGKVVGEYAIFAIHGHYSGTRVGGALNRLQDLARIYDADVYLMAHTHSKAFQTEHRVSVEVRNGKYVVVERPVIYALTGGFLDPNNLTVEQYFDKHPLPRSIRVGTVTIGIDPWRGKIHGFE